VLHVSPLLPQDKDVRTFAPIQDVHMAQSVSRTIHTSTALGHRMGISTYAKDFEHFVFLIFDFCNNYPCLEESIFQTRSPLTK